MMNQCFLATELEKYYWYMYKVNKFTKISQVESYFGPTSLMKISGPDSKNRPAPFSSPTVKKQIFSCEK